MRSEGNVRSHSSDNSAGLDKSALYVQLQQELDTLLEGEREFIANMANCAALLFHSLPDLNWVGFYLLREVDLVLGPFQGKPACVRISPGRGVCGAAALARKTVIVPNVHHFPGHITCDKDSNSEIVVPLIKDDQLVGVLDLDSPLVGRFDHVDAAGLQLIAKSLISSSDL
jgi:L-methionine (R)-S-oxide reductase